MSGSWPAAPKVTRSGRVIGEYMTTWRKLQRLTAAQVADRAGISPVTLRKLEHGQMTVSVETFLRVCHALGIIDQVTDALDPYESDLGRMRADDQLPQRVRRPK